MRSSKAALVMLFTAIFGILFVGVAVVLFLVFGMTTPGWLSPVAVVVAAVVAGRRFHAMEGAPPVAAQSWNLAAWFTFGAFMVVTVASVLLWPELTTLWPMNPALLITLLLEGRATGALTILNLIVVLLLFLAARVFFPQGAKMRAASGA